MSSITKDDLGGIYRAYIAAILAKDLDQMSLYVSDEVVHNGRKLGLEGYKSLITKNIIETNVNIEIKRLIVDENTVASILIFTTKAETEELIGVRLNGTPFSFAENVVYDFEHGKIVEVFSVFEIDVIRSHAQG